MTRTHNIPWMRISVEATAIVASILLAFAIDAWWQDRQDRIDEQEILAGLKSEFVANLDTLTRHLAYAQRDVQTLESMVMLIENSQSNNANSIVLETLDEMTTPATTDLGNGTLNALLSSGRIEILQSKELRILLTAWDGVIGEVWDDQANNAKMVLEIYIPYLIQENYSIFSIVESSGKLVDMDRLLADETFLTLVKLRHGFKSHLVGEFEQAISEAAHIIVEIDNSLR
jgi:hypothetical protein